MTLLWLVVIMCLWCISEAASNSLREIPADLLEALKNEDYVNVVIEFKHTDEDWQSRMQKLYLKMEKLSRAVFSSNTILDRELRRGEILTQTITDLEYSCFQMQQNTLDFLRTELGNRSLLSDFGSLKQFWITNQIMLSLKKENKDILQRLLKNDQNIKRIRKEYTLFSTEPVTQSQKESSYVPQWGIKSINAPALWKMGIEGEGIVIGSIDTGAHGSHNALHESFRGEYGWFDPLTRSARPVDSNGHGTHTIGTMTGKFGIGVAPKSKWMSCRFGVDRPTEFGILSCIQFMTCPTDVNGKNRDCSKAPRIINNSWGVPRLSENATVTGHIDFMDKPIELWHKAGIIPVFAVGNDGRRGCGSVSYPAELPNVIAVGAYDRFNEIAPFSSKGPTIFGSIKPDISAPGVSIVSAWYTGNSKYVISHGSSMAAPHVAGLIALWLSNTPSLSYNQIYDILTRQAFRERISSESTCGLFDRSTSISFPNNVFGYGLANGKGDLSVNSAAFTSLFKSFLLIAVFTFFFTVK